MPPEITPTPAADESFDAVFAEITGEQTDDTPSTPSTPDGQQHASDNAEQPDEQTDGGSNSAESAGSGADTPAADGQGEQPPASDDAGAGEPSGQGEVSYQSQIEALQSQLTAMQAAQQAQQPAPTPAAPEPEPEIYSKDEQAELEALQADWPDLKRLFELMSRQTESNVVKYTFSELGKVLAPLQQSVGVLTGNEHMDAIYAAHSDYDAVFDPCMKWIETQPSFIKAAYQNVTKQGTAEEVATLIQRFKDETKWAAPAGGQPTPTPTPKPKAQTKPAELSAAAIKAAQAIGAVGTKRGAIPNAQDPADFDGAWDEANASK